MSTDKSKKNETPEVNVELSAEDLLNDPVLNTEPEQTKSVEVLFVPFKDFSARVNQTEFEFRTGIPTRITRDLAGDLLRDPQRGYIKE